MYGPGAVTLLGPETHMECLRKDVADACQLISTGPLDRSWRGLLRDRAKLKQVLRQQRFDVLHLHSTHAGLVGRSIGVGSTARVYCPHGWAFSREPDQPNAMTTVVRHVEKRLASRADAIIAISPHEQREAQQLGLQNDRVSLVANGLGPELQPMPNTNSGAIKVLFVGRFDRQKGADLAMSAMGLLPKDRYQLTMIGDQVVSSNFDPSTRPSNVTFVPWMGREDVLKQMQSADVLVMPSRWEGFGLVALEAMRSGRAVIVSDRGNLPDLVTDGETGLIMREYSARALAKAIERFSRDDLIAMGQTAAQHARMHYRSDVTALEIDEVYRKCLKDHLNDSLANVEVKISGTHEST